MTSTFMKGILAEKLCCWALRVKNYRVLATRYKTPVGEIDILALHGDVLVAVEVKARATCDEAAESILPQQQARIAKALQYFVAHSPRYANMNLRFDVMLVPPKGWPTHIENAWLTE